jgi:hypothetical protein
MSRVRSKEASCIGSIGRFKNNETNGQKGRAVHSDVQAQSAAGWPMGDRGSGWQAWARVPDDSDSRLGRSCG